MYSGHLVYIFCRKPGTLRKLFHISLIVVLLPLLAACQPSAGDRYSGYLYFTQGSYLMRFGMRDSSLEAVTHLGNKKIREISRFGSDRLLISETATISQKTVARISWIDLETGEAQTLYSGLHARYIASADEIVYDDGSTLYSIKLSDGAETMAPILSHKRYQLSALVEVSGGRLLIETRSEGAPLIQAYNAAGDGSLAPLDQLASLCSLKGAVWIDDLEQLACRERDRAGDGLTGNYVFADLEGRIRSRPSLPEGGRWLALAYLDDQDVLIFKESQRSPIDGTENSAAWAYDVHSGESRELSATINLGSSVVYSVY